MFIGGGMMKLLDAFSLQKNSTNGDIKIPNYDREIIKQNTKNNPEWIHFGAGNIFRSFIAADVDKMIEKKVYDKGIIVCEDFDKELIDLAYSPYDNISLLVTLKSNGSIDKQVIGSVVESTTEYERYKELFRKKSLQIVSFTITEKGYAIKNASGEILPVVQSDMEEKSDIPKHLMSKITALCYERYLCGKSPLALVSMDNCSNNGDKLKASIIFIAEEWVKRGYCEQEFIEYLNDSNKIAFPCSMIDKITPRPDALVKEMLEKDGFVDTGVIITSKNTYTAPFVNAEETEYLVIEDKFPNGRPALEQAGFYMTDRKTVDDCERMKVCTCLNPIHTALAIFGCLLGYKSIHEEMENDTLRTLVTKMGIKEGMPVVINPGILDPKEFIQNVLEVRLPNPFMPDTPQRIATDTSQKLSIRFGNTIEAYIKSDSLNVSDLKIIPFVIAGWLRYLLGVDDRGNAFELSSDPMLEELQSLMKSIKFKDQTVDKTVLEPILRNKVIFHVDLVECGLSDCIISYFMEMIKQEGAILNLMKSIIVEY